MTIQQAIFEANKTGKHIRRGCVDWNGGISKLKLGDVEDNYLFVLCTYDKKQYKGWQPQVTDIVALDWEICD